MAIFYKTTTPSSTLRLDMPDADVIIYNDFIPLQSQDSLFDLLLNNVAW